MVIKNYFSSAGKSYLDFPFCINKSHPPMKFLMYIILTLLLFNTLLLKCIENILDRVEVDTDMDMEVMDAVDTD